MTIKTKDNTNVININSKGRSDVSVANHHIKILQQLIVGLKIQEILNGNKL